MALLLMESRSLEVFVREEGRFDGENGDGPGDVWWVLEILVMIPGYEIFNVICHWKVTKTQLF